MARYQLSAAVRAPGSSMAATKRRTSSVSEESPLASNMARSPVARAVLTEQGALGHPALGSEHLDVRTIAGAGLRLRLFTRRAPRRACRTPAPKAAAKARGWGTETAVRVRTRSGWRAAATQATMAPQSWPTRSKRVHVPLVGHGEDVGHELVDAVVLDGRRAGPGRVAPLVEGERPRYPAVGQRASSWWCQTNEVWGKPWRKSTGRPSVGPVPAGRERQAAGRDLESAAASPPTGRERGVRQVDGGETWSIDRHAERRPRTSAGSQAQGRLRTRRPTMRRCWR